MSLQPLRLLDNTTGDEYTGLRYEKVPLEVAEALRLQFSGDHHRQAVS